MTVKMNQELPTGRVSVVSLGKIVSDQINVLGCVQNSAKTVAYYHNLQDALSSANLLGARYLDISNNTNELQYPLRIYAALSQFVCARIKATEFPSQPEQLFGLYARIQKTGGLPEQFKPSTLVLPLKNVDLGIRYCDGLANKETAPVALETYLSRKAELLTLKSRNIVDVGFAAMIDGVVDHSVWANVSSLVASTHPSSGAVKANTATAEPPPTP